MASNPIEPLIVFVLFGIILYAMIGGITTIHSVNVGNCAPDENGTLVNCSLSDRDFTLLNNTQTSFSQTFGVITPLMWLLVLGVIVAALMLLASLRRG